VLELDAIVVPSRYTEDDERIRLRDQFQWAATHYAVSEWWAAHGDAKQALDYWKRYLKTLGIQYRYPEANERPWAAKPGKVAEQ
jgi:hypothetical protein